MMAERAVDKPQSLGQRLLKTIGIYVFALFSYCLYLGILVANGSYFKRPSEQDQLQRAIASDKFWNTSKNPTPGFVHGFSETEGGCRLHYITNWHGKMKKLLRASNLVIFLHGYPDSCVMWRHLLDREVNPELNRAILVCVDMPGYGGSDSLKRHGPDEVLNAVAQFVVNMREMVEEDTTARAEVDGLYVEDRKTFIVGHDWGCLVGMRLAAEAPCLADRFILMNAPHPELFLANQKRIVDSSIKIFRQFRQSPLQHRACLSKALHTLQPLVSQVLAFGYIACYQLPSFAVKYLSLGGNMAFSRVVLKTAYSHGSIEDYDEAESIAASFGPSTQDCKASLPTIAASKYLASQQYGQSVVARAQDPGAVVMSLTSYYRDGLAFDHWTKTLQLIADLDSIQRGNANGSASRRRSSSTSSGAIFGGEMYRGSLHAPTTILWGQKDQACTQALCLDGIGDYLPRGSEVVVFPKTGHWFPVERRSRDVLAKVLEHFVVKGNVSEPVGQLCKEAYPGATVVVRK